MSSAKPIFILAPGGSYNPAHYGLVLHKLMAAGYGALSSTLPSTGQGKVTIEDDAAYIRDRMVLPMLDIEERDVIIVGHSYSSLPATHAVTGLDGTTRKTAGKKASVLGQIYIAGLIMKGGDGNSLTAAFGGGMPPHVQVDEKNDLGQCAEPIPPLLADVDPTIASAASRASWKEPGYKDRIAYVKTLQDATIPTAVQDMMLQGSGVAWETRDIDTAHTPSLANPEELAAILIELAKQFESA